jgi:hypothetical protein
MASGARKLLLGRIEKAGFFPEVLGRRSWRLALMLSAITECYCLSPIHFSETTMELPGFWGS